MLFHLRHNLRFSEFGLDDAFEPLRIRTVACERGDAHLTARISCREFASARAERHGATAIAGLFPEGAA